MKEEIIKNLKEGFLLLCMQYNRMGLLFEMEMKEEDLKEIVKTKSEIFKQFHEIGEQLKIIGSLIDKLGGLSIMYKKN